MTEKTKYSKSQSAVLIILRLVIGYHFLYEGMVKLLSPQWTSAPFLLQADWLFSGFFHWLAGNAAMLSLVNFLNICGQIFIGLGLLIGLFSTTAAVAGAVMIALYYIAVPPFVGSYSFVDRNLLEFFALIITAQFPTSNILGLDILIEKKRSIKNG